MGPGWKLVYLIDLFSLANREFFGHLRVGRPKLPGSLIRLRESVFNLWRDTKEALGFSERTVSLQNSCYIESEVCCSTEQLHHLCTYTPLVPLLTSNYFPVLPIHVPRQHSYLIFFPFLIRSNTIRESTVQNI